VKVFGFGSGLSHICIEQRCRTLIPSVMMRLYWPKAEAVEGKWKQPPLIRVK
jgi:hypothetical protein